MSPDGRLVATANRESARTGVEGNTISVIRSNNVSVIDVRKALAGEPAEVARIPLVTPSGAGNEAYLLAILPEPRP